jgi:hypothetical protein|nr:MAG TPA_asm: hypothetical protein [Caudoviricetes sp.]
MCFITYRPGFYMKPDDDDLFARPDPFWDAQRKLTQMVEEGIFDEVDADTAAEIVDMVATEEFDLDWDGSVKLWEWFEDKYDFTEASA